MLTVQVAINNVEPHVRDVTNRYFQYLSQIGPFPLVDDAATGGPWPDDVKTYDLKMFGEWHYSQMPYNPDNLPIDQCFIQNNNVVSVIPQLMATAGKPNQNPWSASFALAYLCHVFGDLHQPLHPCVYVSHKYPDGDEGGNLEFFHWNATNESLKLHYFWDSVCMQPEFERHHRPLNASGKAWLQGLATRLNNTWNNITVAEASINDSKIIAQQSYDIAVNTVYKDIVGPNNATANGYYPDWYQARCIPVAERQIVLGGMRLANILTNMYKNAPLPQLLNIQNGNSSSSSDSSFGSKEAEILIAGFCVAAFIFSVSLFSYHFFWKNQSGGRRSADAAAPFITEEDVDAAASADS